MAEPKEPLTERELEIVRLVGTGAGNKEIASQLFLSPNTVKVHLRNIFTKLEAKSRTEVTMIAVRNSWITVGDGTQPESPPVRELIAQTADADIPAGASPANGADPVSAPTSAEPVPDAGTPRAQPVAPAPLPLVVVPVAPNPQPLPKLPAWQHVALFGAAITAIVIVALMAPAAQSSGANSCAPLCIGPAQPKSGFLLRGEASRWYLRAPLPAARARSTAVEVAGRIYVIGGEVNQAVSGDVMVFEPISNSWTLLNAAKPTPVANISAAAVNGRIYIAGGTTTDGRATANLEVFDTAQRAWKTLAPLPQPVAGHAFAALNDKLYLFGGINNQGATTNSYRYDIARNTWEPVAPMLTRRSLSAAAALSDRIYVIGGFDDGRELTTCEYYLPAANTWATCAPMTVPRSGLGLARIGTNMFAIGGGASGFIGFNERYDAATDRWTALDTPLTSDWQSVAVASRPTEFYVFGGYSGGERLAFTYVYEVFTNRVFVPAFQSPTSKDGKP